MFLKRVSVFICFIAIENVLSAPTIVQTKSPNYGNQNNDQPTQQKIESFGYQHVGLSVGNQLPLSVLKNESEHPLQYISPLPYSLLEDFDNLRTENIPERFIITEDNTQDYINFNNNEDVNIIHKKGRIPLISSIKKHPNLETEQVSSNMNSEMILTDYENKLLNNLDYSEVNEIIEDYPSIFVDYVGYGNSLPRLNYLVDNGKNVWNEYHQPDGDNARQTENKNVDEQKQEQQQHKTDLNRKPQWPMFVREDFEGEDVEGPESEQMLAMIDAQKHPGLSNGIEYDVDASDNIVHSPGALHQAAVKANEKPYLIGDIPEVKEVEEV